jgi:hypothetical protein
VVELAVLVQQVPMGEEVEVVVEVLLSQEFPEEQVQMEDLENILLISV